MNMSIALPSLSRLSSIGVAMALHSPSKFKRRSKSMPSSPKGQPSLSDTLVGEVERLEESCSSSSSFGADWFGQALQVAVNCYSDLTCVKIDIENVGSKWTNTHLDDILHLLVALRDLGRDLTRSVHTLERTRTKLSIWLSKKTESHTQLVEKCMSILRRMAEKLNIENKAGVADAAVDINHAKSITVMVFSALVTAHSFKSSSISMPSISLPTHFISLQQKVKQTFEIRKRSSSTSRFLPELEAVDIALGDLINLLNCKSKLQLPFNLSPSTMTLNELDTALPLLEHKIDQLFKFLISSRVALLNTISSQ